jgi:hypothetical protein
LPVFPVAPTTTNMGSSKSECDGQK